MNSSRRCWLKIDLDKLKINFDLITKMAGNASVMAIVKADAYGHGDIQTAKCFVEFGAQWLAVSGFEEAMRLRRAGIEVPILILGFTPVALAQSLAQNNITQTIMSAEYAKDLSREAQKAKCIINAHIKLDTGMGRIGLDACADYDKALESVCGMFELANINIEGAFTHFAAADSTERSDEEYTDLQHNLFARLCDDIQNAGHQLKCIHCCNSAGLAKYAQFAHTMVRPGIILYGLNPSCEVKIAGLEPAMTMLAAVAQVKTLTKGEYVSYGRTFVADRDIKVATLTVGYADGYPRAMSGTGIVDINGVKCTVLGRVCMDQMIVDASTVQDVKAGDIATIFGGGVADGADDVAQKAGTIAYEIMCGISRRVSRVYIKNGQEVASVDYLNV